MAKEKLEIEVSSDVQDAVKGMDILSKQFERLQKLASLPNLSFAQQERLNTLLLKSQSDLSKFSKAAKIAGESTKKLIAGSNQAAFAVGNFGRIVQDAPFSILSGNLIAVSNNIDPLIESFRQLKASTGSTGLAIKALAGSLIGPAGIALGISAAVAALTLYTAKASQAAAETKKLKEEEDVFVNTLAKEKTTLDNLFAVATSANVPLKARTEAIKELRQNYGAYLKDFSDEEILAGKAASAYQRLATALINVARAKAAEAQQIENSKKILDNEGKIAKIREQAQKDAAGAKPDIGFAGGEAFFREGTQQRKVNKIFEEARETVSGIRKEAELLEQDQKRLADAILKNQVEPFKEVRTITGGITSNVKSLNTELERTFSDLSKVVKQSAEIRNNLDPSQDAIQDRPNPINIQRADRTSSVVITPEALRLQGQYALQIDAILEKLRAQQELVKTISDTITGGLNAGIDQFFNAIANNQDPFEALQQSVKRLVVELAAAVVKMLLLKAITAAISGGTSAGLEGILGGGSSSVLRGDQIRTLTFLRG